MKKSIIFSLSLLFVLGVNIHIRSSTIYFPQLRPQAERRIEQQISRLAVDEIDKKFPGFDEVAKGKLLKAWISGYKKENKAQIKNQKKQEYLRLKERLQDATGQSYLLELDPWNWAHYTDNLLRTGHPGDKVVDGKQVDTLTLAPYGAEMAWNHFLYYLSAFLYRLFSFFKPVPLNTFLFYLPLFFTAVFLAALFLFCYLRWGALAATITCLFVGLSPILIFRSMAGWFDTDVLNLFFPLIIVWLYLKAYAQDSFKRRVFFINLAGLAVGLFAFTWVGWWFILAALVICEVFILLNLLSVRWQYKQENSNLFNVHLVSLPLFSLSSLFWVVVFSGLAPLQRFLNVQLLNSFVLNKSVTFSLWPNVFSTVGELGKSSWPFLVNALGGTFLFIISIAALIILFLRTSRERDYSNSNLMLITIMAIWLLVMAFAALQGRRFAMFLTLPLGIALGWSAREAFQWLQKLKKRWIVNLSTASLIIICFNLFVINSYQTVYGSSVLMINDDLYNLLVKVRDTTPKESIINSWWDFGDWFKAIAQRRVIFDGQHQDVPQAYWMAHALLTDNEKEAVRILQMLDNGANSAFEIINQDLKDPFRAIMLLKKVLILEPNEAKQALSRDLPRHSVEALMKIIFDKPPKAYFIVDPSMPEKIGTLSYLGNWDFLKVYLLRNLNKNTDAALSQYLENAGVDHAMLEAVKRYSRELALLGEEEKEEWVSRRLNFYRAALLTGHQKEENVLFDNGMVFDTRKRSVYLYSSQDSKFKLPKSLFIFENDLLEEIPFKDSDLDLSVLIIKSGQDYKTVLLDSALAKSIFVRLYFLGGRGLKHFKPFIEKVDNDSYIRVFEINWE